VELHSLKVFSIVLNFLLSWNWGLVARGCFEELVEKREEMKWNSDSHCGTRVGLHVERKGRVDYFLGKKVKCFTGWGFKMCEV